MEVIESAYLDGGRIVVHGPRVYCSREVAARVLAETQTWARATRTTAGSWSEVA